jgi:Zn-dependent protease with chaperone function
LPAQQKVVRATALALALLVAAGCAAQGGQTGKADDGGKSSLVPSLSSVSSLLPSEKGEKATVISELKTGPYTASALAIGEEKDLAQRRADGIGFVRAASLEQYLAALRTQLLAGSGVTGVPGRVTVLANPAFAAYSTPDGNVYLAIGWLKNLENADEMAAIVAHELSHVLLAHHSSDLVSEWQHKGQAIQEIVIRAKADQSKTKTVSKADAKTIKDAQFVADISDKLLLPEWSRRQEREADLLGVDLMIRANYSPAAMVSMLEKLKAWETQNKESDDAFLERLKQTAQADAGQAANMLYKKAVSTVSVNHPKTEDRINDVAQYLDRHYGDKKLPDMHPAAWKDVVTRTDVADLIKNYDSAFQARKLLDGNKLLESFAEAKIAASGSTATDAYPNWILARAATSLHRQADATAALQRALSSPEPIPQIYEDTIAGYEHANNIQTALTWTDKASSVFGGAPRWRPVKIRLLRKAGKTTDADAQTLDCSVNAQDWRRLCQEANQTPAPGQKTPPATATPTPKPTSPTPATPAARTPAPKPVLPVQTPPPRAR